MVFVAAGELIEQSTTFVLTGYNLTLTEILCGSGKVGFSSLTDLRLTVRDPRKACISPNV